LAMVYSLHDNPIFFGMSQGIMASVFIIGVASWIGYKKKRLGVALTIGVLLAGLTILDAVNVQATVVIEADQVTVRKLYGGGYTLHKDDIVSLAQVRRRGGGTALVLTDRNQHQYGILVGGLRREQLEEALVNEFELTADPSPNDLKRWSRRSGTK
jgi:hypothetical protein